MDIASIRKTLLKRAAEGAGKPQAKAVIEALSEDIAVLLKNGHRLEDVAAYLRETGIADIKPSTLQTYLSRIRTMEGAKEYGEMSCQAYFGFEIAKMPQAVEAAGYRHRDFVPEIVEFMLKPDAVSVGALQGLRRTGKTTAMLHAYSMLPDDMKAKCAWLEANEGMSWGELAKDLGIVAKKGFKYVFIDEITNVEFFVENSYRLSNDFTGMRGLKICISGTDSLSLCLAKHGPLLDRAHIVRTTWIPFEEWSRLVGKDGIVSYMRWGGLLSRNQTLGEAARYGEQEESDESHGYFTDFLVKSILNTLKRYKNGEEAGGLEMFLDYNSAQCESLGTALFDGLTEQDFLSIVDRLAEQASDRVGGSALNAVAMDSTHRVVEHVLNKTFEAKDVGSVRQIFGKKEETEKLARVLRDAKAEINESVRQRLRVEKIPPESLGYMEFERYLKFMDFLKPKKSHVVFPARHPSDDAVENERAWRRENEARLKQECILCQPAVRYLQLDAQIEAFKGTVAFRELSVEERDAVKDRLYEDAEGRMLEDIVHLEVSKILDGEEMFKAVLLPYSDGDEPKGEYDLVVSKDGKCALFEIKRNDGKSFYQGAHLRNKEFIERMNFWEGKVVTTCVLYRGEPCLVEEDGEFGMEYRNVEEFLRTIRHGGLQDVFPCAKFDNRRNAIPHVAMEEAYDDIPQEMDDVVAKNETQSQMPL